jgi:hypothetical protein
MPSDQPAMLLALMPTRFRRFEPERTVCARFQSAAANLRIARRRAASTFRNAFP